MGQGLCGGGPWVCRACMGGVERRWSRTCKLLSLHREGGPVWGMYGGRGTVREWRRDAQMLQ